MKKTKRIYIAGQEVALNYSVLAVETIEDMIPGDEKNVARFLYSENGKDNIERTHKIAEIMMEEGNAYEKIINGESYKVFKADELKTILTIKETMELRDQLVETMLESMGRKVEVETEKNAQTAQPEKE